MKITDPISFLSDLPNVSDAKEIVASRPYSARDAFQMKDVTRGPSMHNDQFNGLTWVSVPLFDPVRVWLLGRDMRIVRDARVLMKKSVVPWKPSLQSGKPNSP